MNPTNTTTNLPSRLRESTFRDYEQAIQAAVSLYPEVFIFDSSNCKKNLSTFSTRLRDAMASLATYRWETELVDMEKFEQFYPQIKVSHVMNDRVITGSAENIRDYYQTISPPSQSECYTNNASVSHPLAQVATPSVTSNAPSSSQVVLVPLSQDTHDKGVELKLLAGLAALRLLSNSIKLEIDKEQAEWLEQNYDVVLTQCENETNQYIME